MRIFPKEILILFFLLLIFFFPFFIYGGVSVTFKVRVEENGTPKTNTRVDVYVESESGGYYWDWQNTNSSGETGQFSYSGVKENGDIKIVTSGKEFHFSSNGGGNLGTLIVDVGGGGPPPPGGCSPPKTEVVTTTQKITQLKCITGMESIGECGKPIEFKKRIAQRICQQTCTTTYVGSDCHGERYCGPWSCDKWNFDKVEGTTFATQSLEPWLVCTYNYSALSGEEKQRAGVKKNGVSCSEKDCQIEEVNWFPPVLDSDSYDYFESKIKGKDYRFFEISQITCWGGCLEGIDKYHFFSGAINPTREVNVPANCPYAKNGKVMEGEEQKPDEVRLPAKFGWEFEDSKWGIGEWETALSYAQKKCQEGLEDENKNKCDFPAPPRTRSEVLSILQKKWKEEGLDINEEKKKYEVSIKVDSKTFTYGKDLGVGSFYFKKPVERFLPVYEGKDIPEWQKPAPDSCSAINDEDKKWTRKDMYDYFDYYFLTNTAFGENDCRFGFDGFFKREGNSTYLYVYSPSQDSKKDFLWVGYKDPKENGLTKQIRLNKDQAKKLHGPCEIEPFKEHQLAVYPCCGSDPENCSPKTKEKSFKTQGPEIKSILGIRTEEIRTIYPFHLFSTPFHLAARIFEEEGKALKSESKIYRFIDIDWDRTWPSKIKRWLNLDKQKLSNQKVLYDYFYLGGVSFAQFDGGEKNECEKECRIKCDAKCLSSQTCEKQCEKECQKAYEESLKKCGECAQKGNCILEQCEKTCENNLKSCQETCQKNFKELREKGCPNCKKDEKNLGCTICQKCFEKEPCTTLKDCAEKNPCSEDCIKYCYLQKTQEKGKAEYETEEIRDCDEVCADLESLKLGISGEKMQQLKFTILNGECQKLKLENWSTDQKIQKRIRKVCEICQNCQYKVDFVDIEWCSSSQSEIVAASVAYKERFDSNFPVEVFYQRKKYEGCQSINAPSFCEEEEENKCSCFNYNSSNGKENLVHDDCKKTYLDTFLIHPSLRNKNLQSFLCKWEPSQDEATSCPAFFQLQPFDFSQFSQMQSITSTDLMAAFAKTRPSIEKLKIITDAYEEFGGINTDIKIYQLPISLFDEKLSERQPWWEIDKASLLFSSFIFNSVVGGRYKENQYQGSSLRWDFKIKTLPKTQICNYEKEDCYGEKEEEYPFCWPINKAGLRSERGVEKELEEIEEASGKKIIMKGINRLQILSLIAERLLSFRLKIKKVLDSASIYLEYLPMIATHSPAHGEIETGKEKKLGIQFAVWEFWKSLYSPDEDATKILNKDFIFEFYPCGDETGFYCAKTDLEKDIFIEQKVRITGATTTFPFLEFNSGPPPPKKIRIPHLFNWDPVLGAASYWLKFEGAENFEKFIPDLDRSFRSQERIELKTDGSYSWRIRTCADLCSKNEKDFLQCGEWGDPMPFEGYNLFPPQKFILEDKNGQFLPTEIPITISWEPVAKGTDCAHIIVKYIAPLKGEIREDCQEKAKGEYVVVDKILKKGKDSLTSYTIEKDKFPTSSEILVDEKNNVSTNICLGTYIYKVRYCTGESCDKKIPKEDCDPTTEDCSIYCPKLEDCPKPKEDPTGYLNCADCYYSAECKEAGDFPFLPHYFYLVTKKSSTAGGIGKGFGTCQNIIQCTDCKFTDIPKIISNIISCIVWTISPVVCLFLLVYTGIGIYFSFGSPEPIEKAKKIWKAVGIGWIAMLLSWSIVNLIGKTLKLPGW